MVCFSRIWSVPFEAWRTGSLRLHLRRASARSAASSKLRSAVADRDTSNRPLPPTNLSTCTRARGSRPTFDPGLRPGRDGSRDTTFHGVVARFRRIARAFCPGLRRGRFVGSSFWHACRSTVRATPSSQTIVTCSFEPRPPSPGPREEAERVDDPVCLPSVGRSGYRAPGRFRPTPCDVDATP